MDDFIERLLADSLAREKAGDVARALEVAQQALAAARAGEQGAGVAAALMRVADVHFRFGHYREAQTFAEQALDCAADDARVRAAALNRLGTIAAETNDLSRAEVLLHQAIDLYRQQNSREGLYLTLHNLSSSVYLPRGQFALALAADEESYRMAMAAGEASTAAAALITQAYALWITGERQRAQAALAALAEAVAPNSAPMGYRHVTAAELCMDEEEMPGALAGLSLARTIAETTGEPGLNILLRIALSRWHRLSEQAPAAHQWASDAVAYAQRVGYRHLEGKALIARAQAAWATGSPAAAAADARSAAELLSPLDAAYDLAHAALILAAIASVAAREDAETLWLDAARRIGVGGYEFLLERERGPAFPLVAAHLASRRGEVRAAAEQMLARLERVPPLPLHVTGLGRFEVRQGRRTLDGDEWERRKAGELFRFLLLQPGYSATRELVQETFWSGRSPGTTQQLLHQATFVLRRILEPDLPSKFPSRYLRVKAEQVSLELPRGSMVDFEAFQLALGAALRANTPAAFTQALSLYRGELFPADRYADWAAARRESLAQLFVRGLYGLAQAQRAAAQPQAVLDACLQILALDAWHEDAVLLGMEALVALNDRPGALRLYRRLKQSLEEELELSPRPDLKTLADSLRG